MRAAERVAQPQRGLRAQPWWPYAKRGLVFAFFALIAWLLIDQARGIDWAEVGKALRRLPPMVLLSAAALSACSFALYSTFDLIGRAYTRHALATRGVMLVAFISYAFNLNLGSLVGGIAFRYRMYTKFGLSKGVITRVLGLSMLTNWFGYVALSGIVLCALRLNLPPQWRAWGAMLPWIGAGLLALSGAYLLLCAFSKRRRWHWGSQTVALPSARMAVLQLVLSSLNWMLMASVIYTALQGRIDYPTVLGVLLISAVAGIVTHVPGNLGVLEAVFVAMLSSRLPATQLLAGLLAYRAVYYLLPLAVATLWFTRIEWRERAR